MARVPFLRLGLLAWLLRAALPRALCAAANRRLAKRGAHFGRVKLNLHDGLGEILRLSLWSQHPRFGLSAERVRLQASRSDGALTVAARVVRPRLDLGEQGAVELIRRLSTLLSSQRVDRLEVDDGEMWSGQVRLLGVAAALRRADGGWTMDLTGALGGGAIHTHLEVDIADVRRNLDLEVELENVDVAAFDADAPGGCFDARLVVTSDDGVLHGHVRAQRHGQTLHYLELEETPASRDADPWAAALGLVVHGMSHAVAAARGSVADDTIFEAPL